MSTEPIPPSQPEPMTSPELGGVIPSTQDERMWGLFAHLSGLVATALSTMGFIGPLIVWLIKKDQSAFVNYHGKEALNFQLNLLIYMLITIAITVATCGITFPLPMAVGIYGMVMAIIAGIAANKGEMYRYPYTFRLFN